MGSFFAWLGSFFTWFRSSSPTAEQVVHAVEESCKITPALADVAVLLSGANPVATTVASAVNMICGALRSQQTIAALVETNEGTLDIHGVVVHYKKL